MPRPKRTSLADRNSAAIAGPEPEADDTVAAPRARETPDHGAAAPAAAPRSAKRAGAAKRTSNPHGPRSSVYLTPQDSANARSAYLLDYDSGHKPFANFSDWLAGAVLEFASLDVQGREKIRSTIGPGGTPTNKPEKVRYDDEVAAATEAANRADRLAGVGGSSKTELFRYAVRWQSREALKRSGLSEFPPPPARLPKLA